MNSPYMDSEESCIQEAIAQFYSFFGQMQSLKNDIEQLNDLDDVTRNRIMYQLDTIEREYKDSQEWFMGRNVQDVRVGVVGSEFSLKTAVVSLFVEGVLEIEGDEKDGRSKSKITVDGRCKLLLIREETGSPSKQLSQWADVLLLVYSYADMDSLNQVSEFYHSFRGVRQEAPVMLVGIKDDKHLFRHHVKEEAVKEMLAHLDNCQSMDVNLSQQSTYLLFAQACRVALSSSSISLTFPPNFLNPNTCPLPSAISQSSIASSSSAHHKYSSRGGGSGSGSPFPSSPSHTKRGSKRKSMFGGKAGSYNVPKSFNSSSGESYGSGRPVPIKEGSLNKKSQGSLRAEWKKKYLVLTQGKLTYFPNIQDYMSMIHGKPFNLQQITVKVPGQRVSSMSRVATTPPNTNANNLSGSELTDSVNLGSLPGGMGALSDHSNSQSPPPTSLEVSYNSTTSGLSNMRIMETSEPQDYRCVSHDLEQSREFRSPVSPGSTRDFGSSDHFEDTYLGPPPTYHPRYENGGRGHVRNGSFDDNTMLKQLRSAGISYNVEEPERSATMSRIDTKKSKDKKSHFLSAVPASSEEILEGSQESIGRPDKFKKRRGSEKDRNSIYIDRSHSESAKDKSSYDRRPPKNHKRQRSWAGNKLLDVEGGDLPESCEFQVMSSDSKLWVFEANSPEEAGQWVKAIEYQIKQFISESTSHKRINMSNDHEKREISNVEGNGFCADCNSPNPEWASLNLGCLLCIECSGVHRNLGSHISRIRSLTLDEWSPEMIALMLQVGNKVSRDLWEAQKPKVRPIYSSTREERERFIKAKYVDKEYLAELPIKNIPLAEQLMGIVKINDIHNCLLVLAHSTPEDINKLHSPENQSPLHLSCLKDLTIITQLLIWNGGDLTLLDGEKHSPQYYARQYQDILSILSANGCVDDLSDASSNVEFTSSYQQQ